MLLRWQGASRVLGQVTSVSRPSDEGHAEDDAPFEPQMCIANIGPKQRRQRRMFGIYTFAAALVVLAVMLVLRLDFWWRLPLFVPFILATSGYYQARDHT
jgi:predicted nucleic acid-binding Zn ribbon protein